MIQLSYDDEKLLNIKPSGNQFSEQIETLKLLGARFEPTKKIWQIGVGKFNEVFKELEPYHIDLNEYDKREIIKYFDNIDELKVINKRSEYRKFNQELLLCEPYQVEKDIRSFQEIDIVRGLNQNRFLFAHATGLGKSYVLAALLSHLRLAGECYKAIILTSPIGVLNLPHELKKFIKDYDEEKTLVIKSISSLKDRLVFDKDYDIIICGYDSFRSIGDAYDKAINKRTKKVKYRKSPLPLKEWFGKYKGLLFLDECHFLGSPSSLRSKFIDMNLQYFEYRYQFSATPSDKEEKMYLLLKVLNNALVNGLDYTNWLTEYCTLGNKWSRYGINKDTWNYQKWTELQDNLYKNYAVKREKSLLNLPTAYDVPTIYTNMSKPHREIYEAFTYEVINDVKKRNFSNNAGLVANLTNTFQYLQLSIDNPLCLLKTPNFDKFDPILQQNVKNFNFERDFEKLKLLDAIIEEECVEKDNKIIISYYHPITLECLKQHLKFDFHVISADVAKEDRFPLIADFKKSKNKILLASINIANSSFTLTECKAAVFFERTWAYITYEQFRGRIHRIGQDEETRYYNLCYHNSIDNLMLLNLEQKGKVLDGLIRKNTLTPEEWKLTLGGDYEAQTNFLRLI